MQVQGQGQRRGLAPERLRRAWLWLRVVRWLALADVVLLAVLLTASFTDTDAVIPVLGWMHGINFVVLIVAAAVGVVARLWAWAWWFPLLVLVTLGPPGALLGEWLIARRLRRDSASAAQAVPQAA